MGPPGSLTRRNHLKQDNIGCIEGGLHPAVDGQSLSALNYCFESSRPGFHSCFWHQSFSRSSHTSDLQIGNPVATLPGISRYRVNMELVGSVPVYCDWVRQKV